MAILKKDTMRKQVIDLTGPQGNAFYLLGTAMNLCKQLKLSSEFTEIILNEINDNARIPICVCVRVRMHYMYVSTCVYVPVYAYVSVCASLC